MKKIVVAAILLTLTTTISGCGTSNSMKVSTAVGSQDKLSNSVKTGNATSTNSKAAGAYPAEVLPKDTAVGPNFDWTNPSDGPYPTISKQDPIWIDCSLSTQRVRIMENKQAIYTMITSSGMDGSDTQTPTGTYYIQQERGTWFYNANEKEGAEFWVSWKDHGVFLFHSVAMNQNQQIIPTEAAKLGTKASHGCFRLTISDAKWIYDHIQTGTKVVVHV